MCRRFLAQIRPILGTRSGFGSDGTPSFWLGFGVASVVGTSLIVLLVVWALVRLDTHQEFDRIPARRGARATVAARHLDG